MAGERIAVWGSTVKTLESNGAACANNALAQATTNSYSVESDGGGFPDVQFVLRATFGVAPVEGAVIALYAQQLNLDGTDGADQAETTRPGKFIGAFVVNNVATTQTLELIAEKVPRFASYWLHNVNTGQSISAGWTLKATPTTEKLAS